VGKGVLGSSVDRQIKNCIGGGEYERYHKTPTEEIKGVEEKWKRPSHHRRNPLTAGSGKGEDAKKTSDISRNE